jgi:hypothetical protein
MIQRVLIPAPPGMRFINAPDGIYLEYPDTHADEVLQWYESYMERLRYQLGWNVKVAGQARERAEAPATSVVPTLSQDRASQMTRQREFAMAQAAQARLVQKSDTLDSGVEAVLCTCYHMSNRHEEDGDHACTIPTCGCKKFEELPQGMAPEPMTNPAVPRAIASARPSGPAVPKPSGTINPGEPLPPGFHWGPGGVITRDVVPKAAKSKAVTPAPAQVPQAGTALPPTISEAQQSITIGPDHPAYQVLARGLPVASPTPAAPQLLAPQEPPKPE